MNAKAPTIGTFKREAGKEFTEGLIMLWLVHLNSLLNLNKPMSEEQIEMCSIEIVNEFYFLKMSDLAFLFKRIYSGAYGEFYESLSIPKMLGFFRSYFDERCALAESDSLRSHRDINSDETFNYSKNIKRIFQTTTKHSK